MSEFEHAIAVAPPGAGIVYAFGDLALSALQSAELSRVRKLARAASEDGEGALTQRRRRDVKHPAGGACFEYIFTKAR